MLTRIRISALVALTLVSCSAFAADSSNPVTLTKVRTWYGAQVGHRLKVDQLVVFGSNGWVWGLDESSPKRTYCQFALTPGRLHFGNFRTSFGLYTDVQTSPLQPNAAGMAGFLNWKLTEGGLALKGPWYLSTFPTKAWRKGASLTDTQLIQRVSKRCDIALWFNGALKGRTKPFLVLGPELTYRFDQHWSTRLRVIDQVAPWGKLGGCVEAIYTF